MWAALICFCPPLEALVWQLLTQPGPCSSDGRHHLAKFSSASLLISFLLFTVNDFYLVKVPFNVTAMPHSQVRNLLFLLKHLLWLLLCPQRELRRRKAVCRRWLVLKLSGQNAEMSKQSLWYESLASLCSSQPISSEQFRQGLFSVCSFQSRKMRATIQAIPQKAGWTFLPQDLTKKRPSQPSSTRREETSLLQPPLKYLSNQFPPLTRPPRPSDRPPARLAQPPPPPRLSQPKVQKSPYQRTHRNQGQGPHKSTRLENLKLQQNSWKSRRRKWREPQGQWGREWRQNQVWTNSPTTWTDPPKSSGVVAQRSYRLCCWPAWAPSSGWDCREAGTQDEKTDCTFSVRCSNQLTAPPIHTHTLKSQHSNFNITVFVTHFNLVQRNSTSMYLYCESKTFGSAASPNLRGLRSWLETSSHVHQITKSDSSNEWHHRFGCTEL